VSSAGYTITQGTLGLTAHSNYASIAGFVEGALTITALPPTIIPPVTSPVLPTVSPPTVFAEGRIETTNATLFISYDNQPQSRQDLLSTAKSTELRYVVPDGVARSSAVVSTDAAVTTIPNTIQGAAAVYEATQADGTALPGWISVDPKTKAITADKVPLEALPLKIKVKTVVDGKVVSEVVLTLGKM
jgi:hypothetical protein